MGWKTLKIDLYNLPLFKPERIAHTDLIEVMKIPGGWIYTTYSYNSEETAIATASVFVPKSAELADNVVTKVEIERWVQDDKS